MHGSTEAFPVPFSAPCRQEAHTVNFDQSILLCDNASRTVVQVERITGRAVKVLQNGEASALPSSHLENKPFGDLLKTESQRILVVATLLEPCTQKMECSMRSDDSDWNGWERFIQPFEISYEYDNTMPPADPSPEKEKSALKMVSTTQKRVSPPKPHPKKEGKGNKPVRKTRYSLNAFIDRNGQLQTHTASQLVAKTRNTLPL